MSLSLSLGVRLGLFAFLLAGAAAAFAQPQPAPGTTSFAGANKQWVYVGTYNKGDSKGIYRFDFDPATGQLTPAGLAAEAINPSFLAIHPSRQYLYAVGEISNFEGKKAGGVSAFRINPATGKLTLLNQKPSGGTGPCHITVDKAGKNAVVANYNSGSACVLQITADGQLAGPTAMVQHEGKGADPRRQEGPHAHSANLDAANRFAFIADLGLDQVKVYRFDGAKGAITPNDPPAFHTAPGAGPRHFAFHPDGKHAYVIDELDMTITVCDYDAGRGVLTKRQVVSTLPAGAIGSNYSTAEVVVHPSGRFVYGSNRGHNSIAAFAVEPSGELRLIGHQGEGVKTPRNFNIDPTGRWMIVANQDGNSLVVFRIDPKTGALAPTGVRAEVGAPVCVKFMPAPG
jgi:6-phosphogluconolactonase